MHGRDVEESLKLQGDVSLIVQFVSELYFLVCEVLVELSILLLCHISFLTGPNSLHDVSRFSIYINRVIQKVTVSLYCLQICYFTFNNSSFFVNYRQLGFKLITTLVPLSNSGLSISDISN